MTNYTQLDAAIVDHIHKTNRSPQENPYLIRLAMEISTADPCRVVDRRTQSLRHRGVIIFNRKRWRWETI